MIRPSRHLAFTLAEVIVSLVLLVFLALSVHGLLRLMRQGQDQVERLSATAQVARIVFQRLSTDLASALPLTVPLDQGPSLSEGGSGGETTQAVTFYHEDGRDLATGWDRDTIRLTTLALDPRTSSSPRSDVAEVLYYIDSDVDTGEQGLIRRVGTLPGLVSEDSEPTASVMEEIAPQVVSFNVRMHDPEEDVWVDEWEKTESLPDQLEVSIAVAQGPLDDLESQFGRGRAVTAEWFTWRVPIVVTQYQQPSSPQGSQQRPDMSGSGGAEAGAGSGFGGPQPGGGIGGSGAGGLRPGASGQGARPGGARP